MSTKKMKTILLICLFVVFGAKACSNDTTKVPNIECDDKKVSGLAILCSKFIAMNLGPADQFTGYSPVTEQVIALMKEDLAKSSFSIDMSNNHIFIKNIEEIRRNDKVISYVSDRRGEISVSVDPGEYIICTQSTRNASINNPLVWCEPANLYEDVKYKLMIIDDPRAGIKFEWKD